MEKLFKYDIAISFAEEDRSIALALTLAFTLEGFKNIYYYPDNRAIGWGLDLEKSLTRIFQQDAMYVVALFSEAYLDPTKKYTNVELNAIKARMQTASGKAYLLPVVINAGTASNIYKAVGDISFLKWDNNAREIARYLKELFGGDIPGKTKKKAAIKNNLVITGPFSTVITGNRNNINQNTQPNDGQ